MDKCYYKDFIEDEKQFYLHEAGFDSREEQLFRQDLTAGKNSFSGYGFMMGKHWKKQQKLWTMDCGQWNA